MNLGKEAKWVQSIIYVCSHLKVPYVSYSITCALEETSRTPSKSIQGSTATRPFLVGVPLPPGAHLVCPVTRFKNNYASFSVVKGQCGRKLF